MLNEKSSNKKLQRKTYLNFKIIEEKNEKSFTNENSITNQKL